jgi:hypothetical protein
MRLEGGRQPTRWPEDQHTADVAVIQTLLFGGKVPFVEAEAMPLSAPLAALLR